ncbi:MAG: hypothetical protein NZ898_08230 [Myxococcota bacterium]|nr:hypothetical protein [Myxococcota bacterium]MDW8361387.1 hypothetical protein [Myxococcales bacterium]
MTDRLRLGELLVRAGLVSAADLAAALEGQRTSGRRLGEELVARGLLAEERLAQILSNQLSVPWVSLHHVEFSRELLDLVPAELAERGCLIPVYVRRVRGEQPTLFVAMDDPTHEAVLSELASVSGMPVRPMVAAPSAIRHAIRVYYGRPVPERAPRPPAPPAPPPSPPHVESPTSPTHTAATPPTPQPATEAQLPAPPEARPVVPTPPAGARDTPSERPTGPRDPPTRPKERSPAAAARRYVTFTLLDGTSVRLAAGSHAASPRDGAATPEADGRLTARDICAALLARAAGGDVSDVLPEARWEVFFASLLSVLLRKGMIADWEFVEEFEKRRG